MHPVLDFFVNLFLAIYYIFENLFCLLFARKKDIRGEVVLITGAGSGIGKLMSEYFGELGCRLVLWDINATANEETKKFLKSKGIDSHIYTCDVSKRENIYSVAERVKKEVGPVDILVNNAGIVTGRLFLDCSDDMIQKTMDVNATAHFWMLKSFLPEMMSRNRGHIVTIASIAGVTGCENLVDYCASKHAAVGLHETLRLELRKLGKEGIKMTIVNPYFINTGMFEGVQVKSPLTLPLLKPEDVARAVINGVLTERASVYVPFALYLMVAIKYLLPAKSFEILHTYFGNQQSMDTFKGRHASTK